jgi:hypothetical protein
MSLSESSHTSIWPRLSVLDFDRRAETLQTGFSSDDPGPTLGASDLNVVINAPADYRSSSNGALATLFFDPCERMRVLPPDCYQVKCTDPLGTEFMSRAEQGIRLLAHSLMNAGLKGTDLMDLMKVLRASTSRKLQLAILPYDESATVPEGQLRQFRFRTLFASLFAGAELTLEMYAELGCALEEINPNIQAIFLTANNYSVPHSVLLLGEPEPEET